VLRWKGASKRRGVHIPGPHRSSIFLQADTIWRCLPRTSPKRSAEQRKRECSRKAQDDQRRDRCNGPLEHERNHRADWHVDVHDAHLGRGKLSRLSGQHALVFQLRGRGGARASGVWLSVVIAVLRRSPTIVGVRARIDFTARTLESPVRVCRRCPHVSVSTTSNESLANRPGSPVARHRACRVDLGHQF